jgi:uncharacterized protein (DUF885 family)
MSLALLIVLTGCEEKARVTQEDVQSRFNVYIENLAIEQLKMSPMDATFSIGDLSKYGLEHLLHEFDNPSEDSFNKNIDFAKKTLHDLKNFQYEGLTKDQKLTYDVVKFHNELAVKGKDFFYNNNGFQPMSGIQLEVPLAFLQIELESEEEVKAYLDRLSKIPEVFSICIEVEKEKANRGLMMPKYLYDDTINQINKMIEDPEKFMVYLNFSDRIELMNIGREAKNKYKEECLKIVLNDIIPSYKKLVEEIDQIKELSTVDAGISQWTNAKEYYNYLIKSKTSYDMDAEQLREWAKDELSKSQETVVSIGLKNPQLFETKDFHELFPELSSKEEIYAIEDKIVDDLFYDYRTPLAKEEVIPDYLEKHLPGGFYFPVSIDKTDYGNMYLRESTYNNPGLDGLQLYLHENIPGHHMYFSVLYDKNIPMIRKLYNWIAYEEGWAVYVQDFIFDYVGLDKEVKRFFKANSQFANAYYVLIDIGIHYDGWSREEAINKMMSLGISREDVEESIDRTITNPGEIIHYMYGGYKMQQYLDICKDELGDKFNIKEFHDLILENGGVPFIIMDNIVEEYVESEK